MRFLRSLDVLHLRRSWVGTFLVVFLVFAQATFEGLRVVMITNLVGNKDKNSQRVITGQALSVTEVAVLAATLVHPVFCTWISGILVAALAVAAPIVSPVFHLWGTVHPTPDSGYLRPTPYSVIAILFTLQALVFAALMVLPLRLWVRRALPFCEPRQLAGRVRVYAPGPGEDDGLLGKQASGLHSDVEESSMA